MDNAVSLDRHQHTQDEVWWYGRSRVLYDPATSPSCPYRTFYGGKAGPHFVDLAVAAKYLGCRNPYLLSKRPPSGDAHLHAGEIIKDQQLPYDLRRSGQLCWFEYHCYEGHDSSDAELWYRSHQQVKILGVCPNADPPEKGTTFQERCEEGTQGMYLVEFGDGHRAPVFEDEVLDSPDEFCRPDPPERPTNEGG